MATPLTFGNPLKFGPNSCHNAKGRPTFLHRERMLPKLCVKRTHLHIREGPSNGAMHTRELSPRRVVERRHGSSGFSAQPVEAGVDRLATSLGIDESLAFRVFDKIIIFEHWLSKTQKLALTSKAFLLKKTSAIS